MIDRGQPEDQARAARPFDSPPRRAWPAPAGARPGPGRPAIVPRPRTRTTVEPDRHARRPAGWGPGAPCGPRDGRPARTGARSAAPPRSSTPPTTNDEDHQAAGRRRDCSHVRPDPPDRAGSPRPDAIARSASRSHQARRPGRRSSGRPRTRRCRSGDPLDRPVGGPALVTAPPDDRTDAANGPPNAPSVIRPSSTKGRRRTGSAISPALLRRPDRPVAARRPRPGPCGSPPARRGSPRRPSRGDRVRLRVGPPLDLDGPFLQAPLADDDPQRDADQVGVLELHPGALVAVVDQHVEPRRPPASRSIDLGQLPSPARSR